MFSFQENAYYPLTLSTYNPHQVWLKQVNHEIWLNKLKKTLSQAEFKIIRFSYRIPYGNVKENYQPIYKNNDIAKML
ncbi:sigma-70 family RNA polymerase sigma factor, partial ['Bonamia sp.' little leaf phytoplasma]|nr:sigma-70 family RNA polymerase sigma factor ['Bonamia sp.' little leaf phytoplasma]